MKTWVKRFLTITLSVTPVAAIVLFSINWTRSTPISCVGSSGVSPFILNLTNEYEKTNKNVSITVETGGSGFGIEQVSHGFANIGNVSKNPRSNINVDLWTQKQIKTVTIGWEAICMVYIPPKNLSTDFLNNNYLYLGSNNIDEFMSIFSGYLNGTTNNMGYFYINDEDQRFNQSDLNILNNTSILPYVRSGGAFTSGTAFSFFKNSNLTLNLTPQQEHAFETGSYGNDIKIIQTDEANSRAWDVFSKNDIPGSIVYLSSGFIESNKTLIKSKGYKIMGYSNDNGTTITPYTIDQIDKEGGYNWFRPLNTIFSLLDQKSNDIKNFINFINGIDEGWWFKIGAKQTSHDERDSMESWMPDTDLNQFDTLCGAIPDYPQH